jgi:hypothetical protein
MAASVFIVRYVVLKVPPFLQYGPLELVEVGALFGFGFLWPILTGCFPSAFLGGLAADRGWCRHAWQRIGIGLGAAAIV